MKGSERQRALEVVPNLDKVSASQGEKVRSRPLGFSLLERRCIREATEIGERRKREEELLLSKSIRVPRQAVASWSSGSERRGRSIGYI